ALSCFKEAIHPPLVEVGDESPIMDKKQLPTRFPFGHGLSYTTFGYQGLNVENQSDHVHVSLQVTNTGERAVRRLSRSMFKT
ncbi:hypothetical protein, partial [Limosilactobacillus fermentum]